MVKHMHMNVRATLAWSDAYMRRMAGMFIVEGKPLQTSEQVRRLLQDELAQGHEVIPMGECDNFDWKTGCKGHDRALADTPEGTKEGV